MRSGLPVRIDGRRADLVRRPPRPPTRPSCGHLLGMGFDVAGFIAAYPRDRRPGAGLPPAAAGRSVRDAGHVGDRPAGVAARRLRHSQAGFVQRFGRRVEHDGFEWYGFPAQADVRGGDLTGVGLSQAKIRTITALSQADLDLTDAARRRDPGATAGAAGDRPVDGRLVPGALPRSARRVRPRRPGGAQGRGPVVLGRSDLAAGACARGVRRSGSTRTSRSTICSARGG